ncbi:MAG: protein kinase [Acidobacteriota bacterium]|nr:protein kinase [Acidobacteriota bacterium]
MNINVGTRLGSYEIVSRIGAGGMGEVWRARDSKIGRDIAVKVLPASFAADADRLQRFEQEARAAGTLDHPNLVTIYELGTHDGAPFIAMELLEGETLRDKIGDAVAPSGGATMPVRKAIDYASQIANGLAAAHDKGIIHRDLKPENLFVTRDGRLKILDFGLAKLTSRNDSSGSNEDQTQQRETSPGIILGTAGYMSPEQVRGRPVDHRTDIFALGAVLYEMLAGRRAFRRDSAVETMNAILKEDPADLQDVKTPVAPGLERIVRRCVEKAPEERFQSAHDIAFALDAVSSTSSQRPLVEQPSAKWRAKTMTALVAAAIVACVLTGVVAWRAGRRGVVAATPPLTARSFAQLTFELDALFPSLAPDGKTFAFTSGAVGSRDISVQRVDGRNAINLTKDSPADDYQPAFSPDGNEIAFRSERDGGGIYVMGATGESVRRLSDIGYNPTWSPDGTQIAVGTDNIQVNPRGRSAHSSLWILDVRTGVKRQIKAEDPVQPSWSPHGYRIAYWALQGETGQRDIWTVDPRAADTAGSVTRLTNDAALDWNPVWSPDGKWLYFGSDRDGTLNLWRIAIDEQSGKAQGAPEPVTLPARAAAHFTVARTGGELAFVAIDQSETVWQFPFDAAGLRVTGDPLRVRSGALLSFNPASPSPDGEWWTFTNAGVQEDIYLMRRDGTGLRQLTNDPAKDRGPSFSSDGKLIYFYSQRGNRYEVWSIRPDGSDLRQVSRTTGRSLWFPRPIPGKNALIAFNEEGPSVLPFNADGTITRQEPLPPMSDPEARMRQVYPSFDGSMIVGTVARPAAMQGTWVYSFATKRYDRVAGTVAQATWLPSSNHVVVLATPHGLKVIDLTANTSRDIPLPLRSADWTFAFTPDSRILQVHEVSNGSAIWMMKEAMR